MVSLQCTMTVSIKTNPGHNPHFVHVQVILKPLFLNKSLNLSRNSPFQHHRSETLHYSVKLMETAPGPHMGHTCATPGTLLGHTWATPGPHGCHDILIRYYKSIRGYQIVQVLCFKKCVLVCIHMCSTIWKQVQVNIYMYKFSHN